MTHSLQVYMQYDCWTEMYGKQIGTELQKNKKIKKKFKEDDQIEREFEDKRSNKS